MSRHCMGPPRTSVAALTVPPAIAACVAPCAIFLPQGISTPTGENETALGAVSPALFHTGSLHNLTL